MSDQEFKTEEEVIQYFDERKKDILRNHSHQMMDLQRQLCQHLENLYQAKLEALEKVPAS